MIKKGRPFSACIFFWLAFFIGGGLPAADKTLDRALQYLDFMQYDQAVNLLNLCINQEAFETAAVFFQKLVMITPQDFHARLLLEQAEQKRRQPLEEGKTAMTLEIMAKLDVKYRYIFNFDVKEVANKANVNAIGLIKEVLLVDAASFLKRFIELYDLSPTLHYNLAQICNSLNIVGEALRHGTRAIEL